MHIFKIFQQSKLRDPRGHYRPLRWLSTVKVVADCMMFRVDLLKALRCMGQYVRIVQQYNTIDSIKYKLDTYRRNTCSHNVVWNHVSNQKKKFRRSLFVRQKI